MEIAAQKTAVRPSASARHVLENVRSLARIRGHNEVRPEHMLELMHGHPNGMAGFIVKSIFRDKGIRDKDLKEALYDDSIPPYTLENYKNPKFGPDALAIYQEAQNLGGQSFDSGHLLMAIAKEAPNSELGINKFTIREKITEMRETIRKARAIPTKKN